MAAEKPRLRVRIPVSLPVNEEDVDALRALGNLWQKARDTGLVDLLRDFAGKADRAMVKRETDAREARRRRRR